MWNKRKEDEYSPKPAATIVPETRLTKEPLQPAPPTLSAPPPSAGVTAMIGKNVLIKGQIVSREDLTIDGEIEGTLELQENRLTVGPNGRVRAGIKAKEVVVLGTIHGDVETSERIEIRKDAKLVGDIRTARVIIEDGGYFKGSIDIVRSEIKIEAAKPAVQNKPAQSAPTASAAPAAAGSAESKR